MTSVILYIVPEGRVAYWVNWSLLGFSKAQWGTMHITGGLLFLLASLWHVVLNWKAISNYMRQKAANSSPLPIAVAALICLIVYGGTVYDVPPMKQIVAWNLQIKNWQAKVNGKPPYGHAELSTLKKLCDLMKLDLNKVMTHLQNSKLVGDITPSTTIMDIANANHMTPHTIYLKILENKEVSIPESGKNGEPINAMGTDRKASGSK